MTTVLPCNESVPNTVSRQALSPQTTPRAVHGEASPLPPISLGSAATHLVTSLIVIISSTEVPTSTAVTNPPPRLFTSAAYDLSCSLLLALSAVGCPLMTALPPPKLTPARA